MSIRIARWNNDAFEDVRRSPKVMAEVNSLAQSVARQAGPGFVASSQQGEKGPAPIWNRKRGPGFQGRARAIVYPETFRAMRSNAKHNTLVKLMGGSGGL